MAWTKLGALYILKDFQRNSILEDNFVFLDDPGEIKYEAGFVGECRKITIRRNRFLVIIFTNV